MDYINRIIALQRERELLQKMIQVMDPELGRNIEFVDLEGHVEEVARCNLRLLQSRAELSKLSAPDPEEDKP